MKIRQNLLRDKTCQGNDVPSVNCVQSDQNKQWKREPKKYCQEKNTLVCSTPPQVLLYLPVQHQDGIIYGLVVSSSKMHLKKARSLACIIILFSIESNG